MSDFKKTADTYVSGSMTLPARYYTSKYIFEGEKEKIFKKFWMCLGHVSRIPKTGDYFVQEVLGQSLIVLRDSMEMIRVFYNSCRHRGTKICTESHGHVSGRSLQCSYHAWTYSLDGHLIGAPFMDDVPDFPWEENGLLSPEYYIWEGFIFVNLGGNPEPFEVLYEPMLHRLQPWKVGSLKWFTLEDYKVDANWKYVFQNFNECYHCPTIHPMLNKFTNYTSAENDLSEGPFLGGFMKIKGGDSMTMDGKMCGVPLGGELTDKTEKMGYYYTMLGNLLLNIHPDYLMFHLLFPVSNGETRIESSWLFDRGNSYSRVFDPMDAVRFWQITNKQDWEVCELSQLGVQSAGYRPGWYSPRESLLAAFDREYLKLMEDF